MGGIVWTSMANAFSGAINLNSNASDSPDLSGVMNMSGMFFDARSFNGDVSAWDVSSVTDMSYMFYCNYPSLFNGDVSEWDVGNVREIGLMFLSASSFNQDLGGWNISSVTYMSDMLANSGLSVTNYDNTLIGWESQAVFNLTLGADGLNYCNGESARNSLISTYGWTISGDNLNCEDGEPPVAKCKNISIFLDVYGNASISPDDVDDGSTDNFGIASMDLNPDNFECNDLGDNTVTLTVTDINQNVSTCTSTITVVDIDTDSDGVNNCGDNCPSNANPGQSDMDSDQVGDACDCDPSIPDDNNVLIGIPGEVISSGIYLSNVSIETQGTIQIGSNVDMQAGLIILMLPGFIVESGATFNGFIDQCLNVEMAQEIPDPELPDIEQILKEPRFPEKEELRLRVLPNPFFDQTKIQYSLS